MSWVNLPATCCLCLTEPLVSRRAGFPSQQGQSKLPSYERWWKQAGCEVSVVETCCNTFCTANISKTIQWLQFTDDTRTEWWLTCPHMWQCEEGLWIGLAIIPCKSLHIWASKSESGCVLGGSICKYICKGFPVKAPENCCWNVETSMCTHAIAGIGWWLLTTQLLTIGCLLAALASRRRYWMGRCFGAGSEGWWWAFLGLQLFLISFDTFCDASPGQPHLPPSSLNAWFVNLSTVEF